MIKTDRKRISAFCNVIRETTISGPWHWQKVSGEMPAGEQYILPDYGMNQPFVLRSGE